MLKGAIISPSYVIKKTVQLQHSVLQIPLPDDTIDKFFLEEVKKELKKNVFTIKRPKLHVQEITS